MAGPEDTPIRRRCPKCGTDLPANLAPELCPKCLLQAGFSAQAPVAGPDDTQVMSSPGGSHRGLPQLGDQLGHYSIIRLLGEGGMGAVFEAQDVENGRRVALKVLSQTLDSPEARHRFFREGRLAASLNHPNSVYVFGTEEIGGTPVIAMELVEGGTLQDRVRTLGPLPPAEAVDAVLQIIAGLEAAQRLGVLHRDIKPSNCFVGAGGVVKVGDFGLSISTCIRVEPALTVSGTFLGTPAFCSPEQLRGEELSPRSDMYSVGATLFYLLTGRTPFEGHNVVQLLATVLEKRPPSPRNFRPSIPRGLAKTVLRCLEKEPSQRFRDYAELAQALVPYSSTAPTPATLGLRLLAGVIDIVFLGVLGTVSLWFSLGTPFDFLEMVSQKSLKALLWLVPWLLGSLAYYAVTEGLWGATVGKALCRLRVVGADRTPPGVARAAVRALLYVVVPVVPYWIMYGVQPRAYLYAAGPTQVLMGLSFYVVLALYFSTARQRNGFAAVQDLLTKTRVISRVALQSRPALGESEAAPPALETTPTLGPYHLVQVLEESAAVTWFLGFDLRLLRRVWIRVVPKDTPPLPASWRNLGRATRLRWLTGRRSPEENWDAFEAPSGEPLLKLAQQPNPWSRVRFWLYDLAGELSAAQQDGTLPETLALDRIWITDESRAKLLDFPAPGLGAISASPGTQTGTPATHGAPPPLSGNSNAGEFLARLASTALAGRIQSPEPALGTALVPVPLHARRFLQSLPHSAEPASVVVGLKPLLQRVAAVSRLRRAGVLAGCMIFPVIACFGMLFGGSLVQRWNQSNPELMQLSQLLQQRANLRFWGRKLRAPTDQDLEIYIASHYRATITNTVSWSSPIAITLIKGDDRRFAEQSLAKFPEPTDEERAKADAAVRPYLPNFEMFFNFSRQPWLPSMVMASVLVLYVCLPSLLAALLCRGGLVLFIAGVTFACRDGAPASRLRLFWRGLVAWSSLCVGMAVFLALKGSLGMLGASLAGWLCLGALACLSVALPGRGLPDRLAGTWPVPR